MKRIQKQYEKIDKESNTQTMEKKLYEKCMQTMKIKLHERHKK